jgi:predicted small integral membrane protein
MESAPDAISTITLVRIIFGILMGTAARFITLRVDTRQVPSYPNGYFINLVTGFFASILGSVALPTLMANDFAAVTFLMLAVQHFRDIRKQTKESLEQIDPAGFSARGDAYIDGISKTFEARNYISLLTSLGTVLALYLVKSENIWINVITAVVVGTTLIWCMIHFTKGKSIGDICTLHFGEIDIRGSDLYVDGIWVTGMLGINNRKKLFMDEGVALVATPKSEKHRITLENEGQRAAILFDVTSSFGTKELFFTKRSLSDGRIVIAFVPIIKNKEKILATVRNTPILESVRKISRGRS